MSIEERQDLSTSELYYVDKISSKSKNLTFPHKIMTAMDVNCYTARSFTERPPVVTVVTHLPGMSDTVGDPL